MTFFLELDPLSSLCAAASEDSASIAGSVDPCLIGVVGDEVVADEDALLLLEWNS